MTYLDVLICDKVLLHGNISLKHWITNYIYYLLFADLEDQQKNILL